MQEEKITNYGKKIIALVIMLVFVSFCYIVVMNSDIWRDSTERSEYFPESLATTLVFIKYFTYAVIAFLAMELIFALNYYARLNKIYILQKMLLVSIIVIIIILILVSNNKAQTTAGILFLSMPLLLVGSAVNWSFKQFISSARSRMFVLFLLILILQVMPMFLKNYHTELYYKIAGKVIIKEARSHPEGLDPLEACLEEMPKGCKLINNKKVRTEDLCTKFCWSSFSNIIECHYGCPKSYNEK